MFTVEFEVPLKKKKRIPPKKKTLQASNWVKRAVSDGNSIWHKMLGAVLWGKR